MKLTGYAAVFNSRSVDLGGFREVIAPGAFARTISDGHPVFAVHHHNMANILGSSRSQTLKLYEDGQGLHFELYLPDSSLGNDIHTLVKRGDLTSMSFSFAVNGASGEQWRETGSGEIERTLKDVNLFEISTVALPAYPASNVSARAEAHANQAARNMMIKRAMASRLQAA
tara:strand:- start:4996 stop:5508 length:513 start_codon:yes stop_codon:yes gene_type:complete